MELEVASVAPHGMVLRDRVTGELVTNCVLVGMYPIEGTSTSSVSLQLDSDTQTAERARSSVQQRINDIGEALEATLGRRVGDSSLQLQPGDVVSAGDSRGVINPDGSIDMVDVSGSRLRVSPGQVNLNGDIIVPSGVQVETLQRLSFVERAARRARSFVESWRRGQVASAVGHQPAEQVRTFSIDDTPYDDVINMVAVAHRVVTEPGTPSFEARVELDGVSDFHGVQPVQMYHHVCDVIHRHLNAGIRGRNPLSTAMTRLLPVGDTVESARLAGQIMFALFPSTLYAEARDTGFMQHHVVSVVTDQARAQLPPQEATALIAGFLGDFQVAVNMAAETLPAPEPAPQAIHPNTLRAHVLDLLRASAQSWGDARQQIVITVGASGLTSNALFQEVVHLVVQHLRIRFFSSPSMFDHHFEDLIPCVEVMTAAHRAAGLLANLIPAELAIGLRDRTIQAVGAPVIVGVIQHVNMQLGISTPSTAFERRFIALMESIPEEGFPTLISASRTIPFAPGVIGEMTSFRGERRTVTITKDVALDVTRLLSMSVMEVAEFLMSCSDGVADVLLSDLFNRAEEHANEVAVVLCSLIKMPCALEVRAASIVSEVCERNYVFDLAKSSAAKTELVRKGFNCLIPDDIPLMHSPHLTQYQWGKIVVEMPAVKNSIAAAANILAKPKMLEWKWYIDRLEDYFLPFANAIKYATRDLLLKGIPQDKKSTWPPELGEMVKVFFKSISNDVEFSGLQARDVVITPGVSEVQPSCFENKDPVAIDQPGETEPALLVSCREMVSAEVIYNDSPSWQAYQFMINQIRRGEADDVRMFLYDTAVLQPDLHRAVWTHLFKDRVGGNVVGIPIDSPFLACQKSEADSIFESLKAQV